MTRPKKQIPPAKTHRITIRLTAVQYEFIEKQATEMNLPVAEYVRHQAVHGKIIMHYNIVADTQQIKNLTREFSAIGNNLNQIARYFHMGGLRSREMQDRINACLTALMDMRKQIVALAGDFHGHSETPVE